MCCWPFTEVILEEAPPKKQEEVKKKKEKEYILASSDFHVEPIVSHAAILACQWHLPIP